MIRSSKTSIKFCNKKKKVGIYLFLSEYRSVVAQFIDILWDIDKIPTLPPKEITTQVNSWLSIRMVQCAGKQASSIVRGTKQKDKQRRFIHNKLLSQGKFIEAERLLKIINKNPIGKPEIHDIEPTLDSRFFKVDFKSKTKEFDGWLILGSIGNKLKIAVPFKKTSHINKLLSTGKLLGSIMLNNKNITFCFEIPDVPKKSEGQTLGLDIGKTTLFSTSNNQFSTKNNHGHDLNSIIATMCRKQKGSKAFLRCQQHRTNYINWSINQLNLENVKTLKLEKINNLRKGKRTSKTLSHWNYRDIFEKLESKCEELGVQVQQINPTYTSQRCSSCGWTQKTNRNGKQFCCKKCSFTLDADINGAINISLNLVWIPTKERQLQKNRKGFYFLEVGQEPIVPAVPKIVDRNFNYCLRTIHLVREVSLLHSWIYIIQIRRIGQLLFGNSFYSWKKAIEPS